MVEIALVNDGRSTLTPVRVDGHTTLTPVRVEGNTTLTPVSVDDGWLLRAEL